MNSTDEKIPSTLSRRDFVIKSSLVSAGLLTGLPRVLSAQKKPDTPPSEEINVALVGMGAEGRILLESMLNIPGLRFRAVCDIWKYSQTYGQNKLKKARPDQQVNVYTDIDEMLATEKDLDAAVIATPDFWHSPHTVKCLEAGLHVYCEKMMSNTAEGALAMVHAMQKTGKLLQIGHQRRSNPRYQFVLNQLLDKYKLVGKLTGITGQWNRAVSDDLNWPKSYAIDEATLQKYGYKNMHEFRNWRWFKDLSGGMISDLGAHQIDIFNWFTHKRPYSLMAVGGVDYYKTHEHYDNVMALYEYDMGGYGARAFYQVQTTTSSGGGFFETFMGDEGTIVISEQPTHTKIYREDRVTTMPERAALWDELVAKGLLKPVTPAAPAAVEPGVADIRESKAAAVYELPVVLKKPIHQPHLENFFDAIRGKAKLTCDGLEAYESEVPIYRVNPAVAAETKVFFKEEDFKV